ncbi:MAG TPA: PEP-utilizing enzyme [Solirubrobacter sp.]|nr:PEP-utilizing enzyme [Solirubrobacter sp.]
MSTAFPAPMSIATPEGCEGWEEMYPHYALFVEERREQDAGRLWFWNSMHFPLPMPAFDVASIDGPYYALGAWQNRAFAVPPAMGIDYRVVNSYIYISVNPVTDPEKIAQRAEFFQKRAGYYFSNWDELYGKWRGKMESLLAELATVEVPKLPEYEPDEVVFGDDDTTFYKVLDAYSRTLRMSERMWQHHFEFLLLGYGAYLTFSDFCKQALPDIPDQHIAQMVAGIDVLLFKPDAELRRLARLALDSGLAGVFSDGRTPEEIDAELAKSEEGRRWLEELEAVKDPWFNMSTGDGLYHYYRSWFDDPSIPYASIAGHISALADGRLEERPTEELAAERDRLAEGYAEQLSEQQRGPFNELLNLSRTVFPYVEEHKFYCDYWFLTAWYNKVREFGQLLVDGGYLDDVEDVFHLNRHEVLQALEELVLHWASGGLALGGSHWKPIVERRKALLAKLADWTPPPALGTMPEAANDPITVMLWGITPERLQEWARAQDGGVELRGSAAARGVVEGPARVIRSVEQIGEVKDGEILVCGSTSPAWAPIFSRIIATVTDIGGVMSHTAIVCREYGLPAVVGTGRATGQIKTGDRIRVDGTNGVVTVL